MDISPDAQVFWQYGLLKVNATILYTWIVMALLTVVSWLVTRHVSADEHLGRWQNVLETVVEAVQNQIREISRTDAYRYLPFIGTLFLFIAASNMLSIVPGFRPPTGSLSTTAALALCVFVAVFVFGISERGWKSYFEQYVKPTALMLPFNILGELSRTMALAVRLYGNMMSGSMLVAILLGVLPLLFPVVLQLFGLLTGFIHAYIFAVLAMVYIASAAQRQHRQASRSEQ